MNKRLFGKLDKETVMKEDSPIIVDVPKEKPLSDLIDAMKALLKPYQASVSVSYMEENGTVKSVEITARIQTRR